MKKFLLILAFVAGGVTLASAQNQGDKKPVPANQPSTVTPGDANAPVPTVNQPATVEVSPVGPADSTQAADKSKASCDKSKCSKGKDCCKNKEAAADKSKKTEGGCCKKGKENCHKDKAADKPEVAPNPQTAPPAPVTPAPAPAPTPNN